MKSVALTLSVLCFSHLTFSQTGTSESPVLNVSSLSNSSTYDKYASVAIDKNGITWVCYTQMKDDKESIVVKSKSGNTWTDGLRLDNGEGVESFSRILTDAKGITRVFWQGRRGGHWAIYYRQLEKNKWSRETRLTPIGKECIRPIVTQDNKGRTWLAYEIVKPGSINIEVMVLASGKWSPPLQITQTDVNRRASLAASPDNKVWLAWDSPANGNYDIWLATLQYSGSEIKTDTVFAATTSAAIDDSPSITCTGDNTLWLGWNSLRSIQNETNRSNQHAGAIFLKAFRNGQWMVPEKLSPGLQYGEISYRNIDKSTLDAEEEYWHWKQTQGIPALFTDKQDRPWIFWRTDRFGAHNFDVWGRVYNGEAWSDELHLTTFSPGRDEFPSFAQSAAGTPIAIVWEGQTLPVKGEEKKLMGGFVDQYNTNGNNNVVIYGELPSSGFAWHPNALQQRDIEQDNTAIDIETPIESPAGAKMIASVSNKKVFFGDPHTHTVYSDAKYGWSDQLLFLARKKMGLDFIVISDHAEMGRLQNSEGGELELLAKNFSEDNGFIDFTGFEWTAPPAYGHRIVIYPTITNATISSAQPNGNAIEKLYRFIAERNGITSAHHTGQAVWGRWNPAASHDPLIEPNFEIVSFHGRFEYYKNPWEGRRQIPGHHYVDALKQKRKSGILGASDTHFLSPGEGGITAVLADTLSRSSIFSAIKNRHTYATSGPKILVDFTINNQIMGSAFALDRDDSVVIRLSVHGTAPIDHIEVIKNTEDYFAVVRLQQVPGTNRGVFMIYDPSTPQGGKRIETDDLRKISLSLADKALPAFETSYYIRVSQTDGHQAWTSPIWVR